MQLVSYNVQFCRGRDETVDVDRIAAEVDGADVIALQEVDRYWRRSGDVDQVSELAARLPDYHWVYGAGVDLAVEGSTSKRRQFGNMVLSRSPIISNRNHLLPKYAAGDALSVQRSAVEAVIDTAIGALRFFSIHLTHLSAKTRLPQVEMLMQLHRDAVREGIAVCGAPRRDWVEIQGLPAMPREAVFMGDFNCEPDSLEYERIVGPVSDYGDRLTNPEGLVDAWMQCGGDPVGGHTSDFDGRPIRIDYCFVSTVLAGRLRSASVDVNATGSDHLPIRMELDL